MIISSSTPLPEYPEELSPSALQATKPSSIITSEATSLTDAYALLKVMAIHHYTGTVKILVNKSPSIPQAKETYLRFKEVVNRHLEIDIAPAGIILNDPNFEASICNRNRSLLSFPLPRLLSASAAMVSNLLENKTKEDDDDDFSKFWQRYFEHTLLEISGSDIPADKSMPDGSGRKANPEEDISASAAPLPLPPTLPPEVSAGVLPIKANKPNGSGSDQDYAGERQTSLESTPDSIIPFAESNGIFEVENLAVPIPLLRKALELHGRGEINREILLDIFSCEPILLAKSLKMICEARATAGRTNRITKKSQLVEELGTEMLTNILNATVMQRALLQQVPHETANMAIDFWAHSYQCAVLAENIAETVAYPFPEEAFMAGLIHDIGRLALQMKYPETYAQFPRTFDHERTLLEMEQRLFRINHAEVGARALSAWHLDSFLTDAIRYHAEPVSRIETAFSLVKIVFLACRLTRPQKENVAICKLGEELFDFSPDQLDYLIIKAEEKTRQLADRYQIPFFSKKEKHTSEETGNFRQQVMEYSILQGMLPGLSPGRELQETVRCVFQAFELLFDFRPALCLMPDRLQTILKVMEYPGCFSGGMSADIEFSLTWTQSVVVQSFISGEMKIVIEVKNSAELSLADNQLLNSLGTQGFVCVPMITQKFCMGIIVFGISEREREKISSRQNRLEQFGIQAAGNIYSLYSMEN